MKDTIKYLILLIILLACGSNLQAQEYIFRNIIMSDGLSGLLVNAIYKDSEGFVWLGTDNCLDRFDGVKVRHFEFRGIESGRKKRVNCIAETSNKQLWVGNGIGLWRLNRANSQLERIVPEKIDFAVNALLADGDILYIGTEKGLFIQKNGQLLQVLTDRNMLAACNRIMGICLNEDKTMLWLATVQGLHSYSLKDGNTDSYHFKENVPEADYFRCLTRIGETLYLGTMSQGVVRFDTKNKAFSHTVSLGCDVISDISSDGKETVYIATDGNGVHFLSHKDGLVTRSFCHDVNNKDGIRSNSVYSLLVDDRGAVWVGHFQAGVDYSLYQNGLFHTYAYPPLFNSANLSIRSFVSRGVEKVIGSRDGLFYINESVGVVKSFVKPVLTSDLILTICFYQGEYYIGTYGGGMMVLNPETLSLKYFTQGNAELFRKGHIFCVKPDAKGNLWIGTSQGLFCYDGQTKQIKHFTSANSQLPEGNVYEVSFDSTGKGWIATETGMCIYDPASQSLRSNVFPEGFVNNDKVRTIYEDAEHNLYFIREKGSLFTSTLSMDRFQNRSVFSTLPDNSLMSVMEDNQGWLWVACNDGLLRIKKEGEEYDAFTFNDGVPGPTFTNGAAYKDDKGMLWFGNTKGLIYVDPKRVDEVRGKACPIVFTDILANGVSFTGSSLKYDQNNLTFCFTDFAYGLPSALLYEYQLEGVDKDWKLLTAQNEVSYYGLPSGTYTFRVRLPGNEHSEATCQVTVRPMIPWWGWMLSLLMIVGIIVFIRYYVWKRLHRLLVSPAASSAVSSSSAAAITVAVVAAPSTEVVSSAAAEEVQHREQPMEQPEVAQEQHTVVAEEKYKTNRLTEEECKALHKKLLAYVEKEKPYINPDLKMGDLASALATSSHSLSYLLNQYLNQSYYDFINEYRVAQFKKMVADSQYSRYTLTALAELCGFSSRASFFRSFKKSTGVTPNEYIRSIGGIAKEE